MLNQPCSRGVEHLAPVPCRPPRSPQALGRSGHAVKCPPGVHIHPGKPDNAHDTNGLKVRLGYESACWWYGAGRPGRTDTNSRKFLAHSFIGADLMGDADHFDEASNTLARRALFVTLFLAFAGAALGLVGASLGMVTGVEIALVVCSLSFSAGALVTLLFRKVPLQTVATVATSLFAANLCTGMLIAVYGGGDVLNLFVYLVWFFPLLVFNKLVTQPAIGRMLAKILTVEPLLLIACLSLRLIVLLKSTQEVLLGVYCPKNTC